MRERPGTQEVMKPSHYVTDIMHFSSIQSLPGLISTLHRERPTSTPLSITISATFVIYPILLLTLLFFSLCLIHLSCPLRHQREHKVRGMRAHFNQIICALTKLSLLHLSISPHLSLSLFSSLEETRHTNPFNGT